MLPYFINNTSLLQEYKLYITTTGVEIIHHYYKRKNK